MMAVAEAPITAQLTPAALVRLMRRMSVEDKAYFLYHETSWPRPVFDPRLEYITVESPSGQTYCVHTWTWACDCPAGQHGHDCWHAHSARRHCLFGDLGADLATLRAAGAEL